MHIHVVGVGSIGTLVASHLRRSLSPSSKITLLVRRGRDSFSRSSKAPEDYDRETMLTVERGGSKLVTKGFEFEIFARESSGDEGSSSVPNLLRDVVFRSDGTVRSSFGFNELNGRVTNSKNIFPRSPFPRSRHPNSDSIYPFNYPNAPKSTPIASLIIATKANVVLPAVRSLRHRLGPSSTIVLLQNGMGMHEELVHDLFRNPAERPHFILGSVTHGVFRRPNAQFEVIQAVPAPGAPPGEIRFGAVPDWRGRDFEKRYWDGPTADDEERNLSADDVLIPMPNEDPDTIKAHPDLYRSLHDTLRVLMSLTELSPRWLPISKMQIMLRTKLVVNSIINPLSALMSCKNGDLFIDGTSRRICKSICEEAEAVFLAEGLRNSGISNPSEMDGKEDIRLSPVPQLTASALQQTTHTIARGTANNFSSMLVDVRRGRPTEINYMNGYLERLGKEMGVKTPVTNTLADLVRLRRVITSRM